MKYEVGQIIVGRNISRCNRGEVREFRVVKIGTKYIHVLEADSDNPYCTIFLLKDTLANKDWNSQWKFYHSVKEMNDRDEAEQLYNELREKIDRLSAIKIGLEKLRAIAKILE